MKNVSRILALVMALMMLLSVPAMAKETLEYYTEEPTLLSIFNQTPAEWYADEFNRGLLATSTLMDIALSDKDHLIPILTGALTEDAIYVAKKDDTLLIFFFCADGMLSAFHYTNTMQLMVYSYDNASTSIASAETYMNNYVSSDIIDSYYQVPATYIANLYNAIMETIEGN